MSNKTTPVDEKLHEYLLSVSLREPGVMRRLREETAAMPQHNMQIAPEQGQFMQMLLHTMGAHRCIEVGTFTGYSTLAMALALPEDGRILACDVSEDWTAVARRYWEEAGVADRIELVIAPASETLADRIHADDRELWDFAFIDADKSGYEDYYEKCLALLRPGGIIAVDNTLWNGRVTESESEDADTRAIRAFNEKLYADERIDLSLVPIGDGLTLARKQEQF